MAKLIVEGSSTLSSSHTFGMTNAQTILSAEIFVSDTSGAPPAELTGAARNQWLLDAMVSKLVVYMRSETRRLSKAKRDAATAAAQEAEIEVEVNF